MTTTTSRPRWRTLAAGLVVALALAACADDGTGTDGGSDVDDGSSADDGSRADEGADDGADEGADAEPTTVRLLSHDSFVFTDDLLAALEEEQGIVVELLPGGDAGTVVNQAILTAGNPQADVLFGIDSTLLTRGLEADLFEPYEAEALAAIPDDLELDSEHRVTPIDVSDVCVNYDRLFYGEEQPLVAPESLDDLVDPAYRGQLVVQNPASSSPGLAFLLRTIAEYGEDGWQAYWQALVDNDVQITAGWEDAYYGAFSGGLSSEGDRPLVVSYSTSPPAEVVYGPDPDAEESPTGSVVDTCYRQVEFAGVLAGTEVPEAARAVVEFLASPAFQESVALNMFVEPVREDVALPEVFVRFAERPDDPVELAPEVVTENRDRWIEEWTELVLG